MAVILVVDDETPLATMLKLVLVQDGHTVLVANTGQAALGLAGEARPDLAFIDVMLPLVDGRQLCRALHAEPGAAGTPVILMSAARPTDWRSSGAVDFLDKPFAIAAVPDLIERHLGMW